MNMREYLRVMMVQECDALASALRENSDLTVINAIRRRLDEFADQFGSL